MDSQSQNNPPSRRPPGSRFTRPNPPVPHRQYAQGPTPAGQLNFALPPQAQEQYAQGVAPAGQFTFAQPPQAQGQYARGGPQSQPPPHAWSAQQQPQYPQQPQQPQQPQRQTALTRRPKYPQTTPNPFGAPSAPQMMIFHGAGNPAPPSEMVLGYHQVTLQTHRPDAAKGPVNKKTGDSYADTILTAEDGFNASSLDPQKQARLVQKWADYKTQQFGPGVPVPSVVTIQEYSPWDGQGSIVSKRGRPSFAPPPRLSLQNYKRRRLGEEDTCCKCRATTHLFSHCVGPPTAKFGDMYGCVECNTTQHCFDDCHKVNGTAGTPPLDREQIFVLLVVNRVNKPPIRTNRVFNWGEYEDLIKKYKLTSAPWTREFAIELLETGQTPWVNYDYAGKAPLPVDRRSKNWPKVRDDSSPLPLNHSPTNPGPTNPSPSPTSVTHKDPPADAEDDVMSYDAQLRAVIYRDDEFRRLASMAGGRL
ncbi:putative CCHC-type domain-containing protein [Seiridium unicorne]|uniref:CCHC-type domain-containing protein n=1 Tax=Seiridium unicorne TaxID=138068 RepID=A0ABR2UVZ1_9PEZI